MKPTALSLLALFPLPAAAQSFEGANLELQYQHYDDGAGFTVGTAEAYANAGWSFGSFGTQIGLAYISEVDSSAAIDFLQFRSAALHLTMDASDQLRLGAMVAVDITEGVAYLYAIEGLYLSGPLRLEARLGDSFDDASPFALAEITGSYDLSGGFKLRGGALYNDYGTHGFYHVARLGVGYDVNPSTEVYVDYARHGNNFGGGGPTSNGSLWHVGLKVDLGGTGDNRLFNYHIWN